MAEPAFVARLTGNGRSDEERKKLLAQVHPDHAEHYFAWEMLLEAFEGRGGFLNGGYLWPFPRESQSGFEERCKMARYHNYLETLVDLYVRFIFTQGVKRSSKSKEYDTWLEDVDGAGTKANDFLKKLASISLVNGHAGMLVDKTRDEATGPTLAEERARVVARLFTAPSILDWRHGGNELMAVKLLECAPAVDIVEPLPTGDMARQYLLWDKEGWARFDADAKLLDADTPQLGLVPLVVLRPKPSQLSQMTGRALISNANVVRALFNRASEEDQVLREQAFSVLTVQVSDEGNVDDAKASLGNVIGTAKALVVKGVIKYETPSQEVPGTIRDNMSFLVQEIYRAAHVRFKRDSLAAESGESIRLQYTELNEMLQGFSKALAQAEREMARAWFAWTSSSTTREAADAAFKSAAVEVEYPSEFFLDALMTDLEAWAEALRLRLGDTMEKHIKKRAVRRIDPDLPVEELKKIDAEIDALEADADAEAKLMQSRFPLDTGAEPPERNGNAVQ